ncbi:hypothetical protein GCM10010965_27370 [Caldalkalibacillus thermarum]|nr:hypothetical protein GCM10010965_27370 [Caldalkalibacillus thermarum]
MWRTASVFLYVPQPQLGTRVLMSFRSLMALTPTFRYTPATYRGMTGGRAAGMIADFKSAPTLQRQYHQPATINK